MSYLFAIHEEEPEVSVSDIQAVFTYWKSKHPRSFPRVHSGLKEWKLIKARLADGFTVDDLKQAIDGIHVRPWNNGENPSGGTYVHLDLAMRDAKHVDMYRQALSEQGAPVVSEHSRRTARAGLSWAERKKQQLADEEHARITEGPDRVHG